MSEKEKQELLEQINKLSLFEFSKLCLKIVKKIANKNIINEKIETNIKTPPDKDFLVKLMIENDIKIDDINGI